MNSCNIFIGLGHFTKFNIVRVFCIQDVPSIDFQSIKGVLCGESRILIRKGHIESGRTRITLKIVTPIIVDFFPWQYRLSQRLKYSYLVCLFGSLHLDGNFHIHILFGQFPWTNAWEFDIFYCLHFELNNKFIRTQRHILIQGREVGCRCEGQDWGVGGGCSQGYVCESGWRYTGKSTSFLSGGSQWTCCEGEHGVLKRDQNCGSIIGIFINHIGTKCIYGNFLSGNTHLKYGRSWKTLKPQSTDLELAQQFLHIVFLSIFPKTQNTTHIHFYWSFGICDRNLYLFQCWEWWPRRQCCCFPRWGLCCYSIIFQKLNLNELFIVSTN